MTIAELREELTQARSRIVDGDANSAISAIDRALQGIEADHLLTTSEAAELLGIRSVNTLKVLLRMEGTPVVQHGNRTMISVGEVEHLRDSERVRGLRATSRMHEASAHFGEEPMSNGEIAAIEAGRPGKLPWAQ